MSMSKRSKLLSLSIVVLTIGIVTAVTAPMSSSLGSGKENHVHLSTTRYAISTRLFKIFNVLHHRDHAHSASVTTTPPLPSAVAQVMARTSPNLDPSAAVFAGGAYPTWVVPGTNEVCLINAPTTPTSGYGGVCGTISAAERGLAVTTENAAGEPVIFGLVPNGNAFVAVKNVDDAVENVPVTNNVYEISGSDPGSASLTEASGARTTYKLPTLSRAPGPSSGQR
jgi:hypothetical protein